MASPSSPTTDNPPPTTLQLQLQPKKTKPPPANLLTLPRELRDEIYSYIFTTPAIICILDHRLDVPVPNLRRVNRQVSAESREAWLKWSIFHDCTTSTSPMQNWLDRIPLKLHKCIRTIHFWGSTGRCNGHKMAMLGARQDELVRSSPGVNRGALVTSFTTRTGGVVWKAEMPDEGVCEKDGRFGAEKEKKMGERVVKVVV